MNKIELNGQWKIRWTDGQRGGAPHFNHEPGQPIDADLKGRKKDISDLYDDRKWTDAQVPGEVHLDLWRSGIIEDPYKALNVLKCRWVEECVWYYRKVFDVPEEKQGKYSFLKFEGLDLGAIVYLNGKEIGRHNNAFYPLLLDVSGKLKNKDNILVVRLESGLYSVSEKNAKDMYTATMSIDQLLHKRMWLRKPQFSTAWDWAPRLMNVGIHKDVLLYTSDFAVIVSDQLRNTVSPDLKSADTQIRLFSALPVNENMDISAIVTMDGTKQSCNMTIHGNEIRICFETNDPKLWYPTGYGEQILHDITFELYFGKQSVYSGKRTTGFRYVQVDQGPHPEKGNYFKIRINGIDVFAKGANLVPADMIPAAIDKGKYDRITDLALRANFNFLRIWGGGIYENDSFFELCDKKGILVWHDFISACATLPYSDPDFAEDILKEAEYNVRRLSCYPSLIVWCGNNEVDVYAIKEMTGSDDLPQDTHFYFEDLAEIVGREDPEKFYQPMSPYSFDGSPASNDFVGDQHPWTVGFRNKDHRDYWDMQCRFPNEGGILGPSSLSAIRECVLPPFDHVHSFQWDVHDNMLESLDPMTSADNIIKFWTDLDPSKLSIEEYAYLGGYAQSEGLKTYIDNFRSRKFDSSGAVFWMFNDCWPTTISWTIIDYRSNLNPAYHPVRRAFSPVSVIVRRNEKKIEAVISNDTMQNLSCKLITGVFTIDGRYTLREEADVLIPENSRDTYFSYPDSIDGIPFALLYDDKGSLLSANRYIEKTFCELDLLPAKVSVTKSGDDAILESNRFVLGVCLDLNGDTDINDNMFDLFPGIPYVIPNMKDFPGIKFTMNNFLKN